MSASHYDLLQLEPGASPAAVKAAYRRRMKELHPDHGGSDQDAIALTEAYKVLADDEQRAWYDDELSRPRGFPRALRALLALALALGTLASSFH